MKYPIATKQAKGRSAPLTAEMLVNMYAEQAPSGARNDVSAVGCPGFWLFSTIATTWGSYIRGVYHVPANNTLWCVVGLTLYKISSAGVASSIGTIGGFGRVSMADNGVELVIAAGSITYVVTLAGDSLAAITDSDFPNADTVAFLKGYFVFNNNQAKGQVFWSALYGGAIYDALDFGTAESLSDNTVAVWRDHDRVLLFGTNTIESWFASGDVDAVFAPIPGSTINRGLGARWSIASLDNRVVFLDSEGIVRIADEAGTRLSTHAIEHDIAKGAWRHDDANAYGGAVASSYVEEGHEFYILTVPNTGTFVYDAATGLWHKRKSKNLGHSRASFHVSAFGKIICGDTETGKLYEQNLRYYDEVGEHIIAEIQFPQVHNNGNRFIVPKLELFIEAGTGHFTTPGDPVFTSYDLQVLGNYPPASSTNGTALTYDSGTWIAGNIGGSLYRTTGQPHDNTWTFVDSKFTGSTGKGVNKIASNGAGTWVAVGGNGNLSYSTDDGITWTKADLGGTENDIYGVAYHDGLWVEAGTGPTIRTSTDAINWTVRTITGVPSVTLKGVAYGNNIWIAASNSNGYAKSVDGITWSYTSGAFPGSIITSHPQGFGFFNGRFINTQYGPNGSTVDNIFSSTDGLAWVAHTTPTEGGELTAIHFDDPRYVLASLDYMWYSYDLNNWTVAYDAAWFGGQFFVISSGGGTIGLGGSNSSYAFGGAIESLPPAPIEDQDPEIMLDVSSDSRSFDVTQPWRKTGKQGEYSKRVIWRRLGQHRSFTPRFTISAPIKRVIFDATIDVVPSD